VITETLARFVNGTHKKAAAVNTVTK